MNDGERGGVSGDLEVCLGSRALLFSDKFQERRGVRKIWREEQLMEGWSGGGIRMKREELTRRWEADWRRRTKIHHDLRGRLISKKLRWSC